MLTTHITIGRHLHILIMQSSCWSMLGISLHNGANDHQSVFHENLVSEHLPNTHPSFQFGVT